MTLGNAIEHVFLFFVSAILFLADVVTGILGFKCVFNMNIIPALIVLAIWYIPGMFIFSHARYHEDQEVKALGRKEGSAAKKFMLKSFAFWMILLAYGFLFVFLQVNACS